MMPEPERRPVLLQRQATTTIGISHCPPYNKGMIEIIKHFSPKKLNPKYWGQPQQTGEVTGRYLKRRGSCNQCGRCCTNIYLIHENDTIKTVAEFEQYQRVDKEFEGFIPIDTDEHGVRFQCKHLQANNHCAIYTDRPSFCRQYPSEKGVLLGGVLAEECGYSFEVIHKFKTILAEAAQKAELPRSRQALQPLP